LTRVSCRSLVLLLLTLSCCSVGRIRCIELEEVGSVPSNFKTSKFAFAEALRCFHSLRFWSWICAIHILSPLHRKFYRCHKESSSHEPVLASWIAVAERLCCIPWNLPYLGEGLQSLVGPSWGCPYPQNRLSWKCRRLSLLGRQERPVSHFKSNRAFDLKCAPMSSVQAFCLWLSQICTNLSISFL